MANLLSTPRHKILNKVGTKKVRRVLYPMVFVGTAYFLLQYIVPGTNETGNLAEIWKIYVFPYTLYWYLPSLFWVFLAVGLLDAFKRLDKFGHWAIWTAVAFALLLVRDMVIPEAQMESERIASICDREGVNSGRLSL